MSSELIWNIVKKNNCFMRKQKQGGKVVMFSTEKMNIMNENTPKNLSLCNKRAVGVNCENHRVVLSVKSTKHANKPYKMVHKANVKKAASVSKEVIKGNYCPRFEQAAVRRFKAYAAANRRAQSAIDKKEH